MDTDNSVVIVGGMGRKDWMEVEEGIESNGNGKNTIKNGWKGKNIYKQIIKNKWDGSKGYEMKVSIHQEIKNS